MNQEIKKNVREILQQYQDTRDCDLCLFHKYILEYHHDIATGMALSMIELMHEKELPSMETVSRLARMIKKDTPRLQGEGYRVRKQKERERRKEFSPKNKQDWSLDLQFHQPTISLAS
jgi:hypothetical protein